MMINTTSVNYDAQQALYEQGGEVIGNNVVFPEGTETNAPLGALRQGEIIDDAEFMLPDGLVLFCRNGNLSKQ